MGRRGGFAALLMVTIAVRADGANLKNIEGDADAGRELAISVCAGCHAVSEGQPFTFNDPPDFLTIANRLHVTAASLRHRIAALPHASLPGRMPNPMLNDEELANVVAYIMTMRER